MQVEEKDDQVIVSEEKTESSSDETRKLEDQTVVDEAAILTELKSTEQSEETK